MELFRLLGTIALDGVEQVGRDLDNTRDDAKDTAETFEKMAGKVGEWSAKLAAATAAAASAIGGLALNSATELESSFNSFAASTGIAIGELEAYKDVMQEIYNDNYGESFEDIADSMSQIKQQMGDIDSDALKDMTEDALLLRDTFDYEVGESTRAAKMLMDQFGISSKDAFNMIAQGTQKGLNKNGDLLDSINEYAVHYKQMGYDAKGFFNSLQNGTKAGTFSVDKLGDAMKEFGIRVKDESTTTTEAFQKLGYTVDGTTDATGTSIGKISDLQAKFAEGGESAQEATQEVLEALFAMDDKVAQNAAGVGLFGTMWEDLGAEGIKALTEVNGTIDNTKDALTEVSKVKYKDLGTQFEGLKRKMESNLIRPLGDKLTPIVSKLITTVEKKMPQIEDLFEDIGDVAVELFEKLEPAIEWVIDDALPVVVELLGFVAENFQEVAGGAMAANGAVKAFTGAATGNLGMLVTGVAEVVGGVVLLADSFETQKEAEERAKREMEEFKEQCYEARDAAQERREEIDKSAEVELAQVEITKGLWAELQTLCDETGNVKEADKDRADFILNQLNEALGTEYEMTGNQIKNYQDLQTEIEKTLKLKEAEIYMNASEQKYQDALEKKLEQEKLLVEQTAAQTEAWYDLQAIMDEHDRRKSEWLSATDAQEKANKETEFHEWVREVYNPLYAEYVKATTAVEATQATLGDYMRDVAQYENAYAMFSKGEYDKTIEYLEGINRARITAKDIAEECTEEQLETLRKQVDDSEALMESYKLMMDNAVGDEKDTFERRYNQAKEQYEEDKALYKAAGGGLVAAFTEGVSQSDSSLLDAVQDQVDAIPKKLDISAFESLGKDIVGGIARGMDNKELVNTSSHTLMNGWLNQFKQEAEIKSPSRLFAREIGAYIPSGIAMGIEDNESDAIDPMRDMIGRMSAIGGNSVVNNYSNSATTNNYGGGTSSMEDKLTQLIDSIKNLKIYLNGETLVGELAPTIDMALGDIATASERGQ